MKLVWEFSCVAQYNDMIVKTWNFKLICRLVLFLDSIQTDVFLSMCESGKKRILSLQKTLFFTQENHNEKQKFIWKVFMVIIFHHFRWFINGLLSLIGAEQVWKMPPSIKPHWRQNSIEVTTPKIITNVHNIVLNLNDRQVKLLMKDCEDCKLFTRIY